MFERSAVREVLVSGAELLVARLDAGREAVHASAALLSDAERHRASRYVFDRDRWRFVLARARLRRLLGARLGVRPTAVDLVYGRRGKPALAPRLAGAGLRFNVSHREDVVVYAFSRRGEVGVDVEAVRAMDGADDVAARCFSRRENEAYRSLAAAQKPLGFFNCWTRKEAFVKALGEGLHHPLGRFEVSLVPGEPARILRVEGRPSDDCDWRLEGFSPAPGFVGAVVTES